MSFSGIFTLNVFILKVNLMAFSRSFTLTNFVNLMSFSGMETIMNLMKMLVWVYCPFSMVSATSEQT